MGRQGLRRDGGVGGVLDRRARAASAAASPGTGSTASISRPSSSVLLVGADHPDGEAGRAGQLLLEGALQAGEAQLVAGRVARRRRPRCVSSMTSAVAAPTRPSRARANRGAGRQQPGVGREDGAGQVEHLRPDRLEVGTAQRDDRDELTLRGGLDIGDDVLGGDAGGGRQRGGQRGQVGDLGRVDPDVDDLGRGEQGCARGVGDGGPLGQRPGHDQVLPLPQLGMDQGRLGDDLPAVLALPEPQASRRSSSPARRRGPRWRSSRRSRSSSSTCGVAERRRRARRRGGPRRSAAAAPWSASGSVVAAAAASRSPAAQSSRKASRGGADVVLGAAGAAGHQRNGDQERGEEGGPPASPHGSRLSGPVSASCARREPGRDRLVRTARWRTGRRRGTRPGGRRPGPER